MKVIILAAGRGTRMGKYCRDLPKGMLSFNGKTLLEWQLIKLRESGLNDISIITGYNSHCVRFPDVKYFHNPNYQTTNMVESLMCARETFDSDVLVAYSDIIYTSGLIESVKTFNGDIGVAVDADWRSYWQERYGTTETDLESLVVDNDLKIKEIGKPVDSSDGIDYRYIGLIRFSKKGVATIQELYDRKKLGHHPWLQSGKSFEQGYMTDLLHEVIQDGAIVEPIIWKGGWLEFDTETDYEFASRLSKEGKLHPSFF